MNRDEQRRARKGLLPHETEPVEIHRHTNKDNGGVLPLASATEQGQMSAADYVLLHTTLGSADESTPGGNVAVAATTVTQVAGTITLAPGIWLIWGWANLLMGAGAGTADLYVRDGAGAQVAGTLATWALAAGAQGGGTTPIARVTPAAATAYNLACYSSAALTARVTAAGAGGFNNGMGIRAVRLA